MKLEVLSDEVRGMADQIGGMKDQKRDVQIKLEATALQALILKGYSEHQVDLSSRRSRKVISMNIGLILISNLNSQLA